MSFEVTAGLFSLYYGAKWAIFAMRHSAVIASGLQWRDVSETGNHKDARRAQVLRPYG